MTQYFSDRERGPIARTHETIGLVAWGGIVAAISSRISKGAFGHSYPEECPDGQGPIGTSAHSMGLAVLAEIPDLAAVEPQTGGVPGQPFSGWPVVAHRLPPTLAILDLVEFCHEHVAEPLPIGYHTHFKHDHLRFDRETGTQRWSTDINLLFARNGIAYELTPQGRIVRTGTPVVGAVVRQAVFATGDSALDELLERARAKYLSADPSHRKESLEQLWDAFERTNTMATANKQTGMRALIDKVTSSPALADRVETEAKELTKIGNDFRIRHQETNKVALSPVDIDYLFHRCFALLALAYLLHLNPMP